MPHATLLSEARAKITWGDSSELVHEFLVSNGTPSHDANAIVKGLMHERNLDIKRIGIKKLIIGALIFILAAISIVHAHDSMRANRRGATAIAAMVIAALYGLGKFIDGVRYTTKPESEKKSITEIQ